MNKKASSVLGMEERMLGRAGWKISVIGFGEVKLPQTSQGECDSLSNRTTDLGFKSVDTADHPYPLEHYNFTFDLLSDR